MANSPKVKTNKTDEAKTKGCKKNSAVSQHNFLQKKKKYQNMHTAKDRQVIAKVLAGKLLKKYRLLSFAKKEFGF